MAEDESTVYAPAEDTQLVLEGLKVRAGERAVELGTGRGDIALELARRGARVEATDVNPAAVAVASARAQAEGLPVRFFVGDLFAPCKGAFDLVVFNPPYLPTGPQDRVAGALNAAFDGGADGLAVTRRFLAALPLRLTAHLWGSVRERKVRALRATSEALVVRLMDLIRADLLRSEEGRRPAALRAGVGVPHQWLFDFEAMAGLLRAPSGASALGEARRRRIEACLGVLRADARVWSGDGDPVFATVGAAVAAWRERLPATAALVRAIAVAELEVGGRYVEAVHDGVLGRPAGTAALRTPQACAATISPPASFHALKPPSRCATRGKPMRRRVAAASADRPPEAQ